MFDVSCIRNAYNFVTNIVKLPQKLIQALLRLMQMFGVHLLSPGWLRVAMEVFFGLLATIQRAKNQRFVSTIRSQNRLAFGVVMRVFWQTRFYCMISHMRLLHLPRNDLGEVFWWFPYGWSLLYWGRSQGYLQAKDGRSDLYLHNIFWNVHQKEIVWKFW